MHLLIAASAKNSQGCRVPVADRILMIFVYRCDVIPFDMTGNNNDTGGPIDEKSYQWFGASISSSGDDGVIVVRLSFLLGKNPASLAAFLIFEGAGESSPHSIIQFMAKQKHFIEHYYNDLYCPLMRVTIGRVMSAS